MFAERKVLVTTGDASPLTEHDPIIRALRSVGLEPDVISPATGYLEIQRKWNQEAHALVLYATGPEDINPERYRQQRHEKTEDPDIDRDAMELDLVAWVTAKDEERAGLGICRGEQMLAVGTKGSLGQHIIETTVSHSVKPGYTIADNVHDIELTEGSKVYEIFGTDRISLPSSHRQMVVDPGEFCITGRADDNTVAIIEHPRKPWLIGVEEHPEEALASVPSQLLFNDFARAAGVRTQIR